MPHDPAPNPDHPRPEDKDALIDEAEEESFPASDPPTHGDFER